MKDGSLKVSVLESSPEFFENNNVFLIRKFIAANVSIKLYLYSIDIFSIRKIILLNDRVTLLKIMKIYSSSFAQLSTNFFLIVEPTTYFL